MEVLGFFFCYGARKAAKVGMIKIEAGSPQ